MELRGKQFGHIAGGSGVQGFFGLGDEYPHHRLLGPLGLLDFTGMTFVAKTFTLARNVGNLPVQPDGITVDAWFPRCIHVSPRSWWNGDAINKVGLTNNGLEALLTDGRWQTRTNPFMLSFMSLRATPDERVRELKEATRILGSFLGDFRAPIALQINVSCPNVGVDHNSGLVDEVHRSLDVAAALGIPLLPKVDALASVYDLMEIGDHPACDGIVTSNTIKFGTAVAGIDWEERFGFRTSPLEKVGKEGTGGGGASGAILFPLVEAQVQRLRALGFAKRIQAGGGVQTLAHVRRLKAAGADSIAIASVAMLRPWRVQPLIRGTNRLYAGGLS